MRPVWLTFTCLVVVCGAGQCSDAAETPPSDIATLSQRARSGDAQAQLMLGFAYDMGRGARHSRKEAERWYRLSAESGNAEAQNAVGSVLQEKRKYADALTWYEKSAAAGFPRGINNAGYLYDLGLGVPQDRSKARDYYLRAANFGWAESMWNLANIYYLGQVGPPDKGLACVWTFRAGKYAKANEEVLRQRVQAGEKQLSSTLALADLESCKSEAANWQPDAAQGEPSNNALEPTRGH